MRLAGVVTVKTRGGLASPGQRVLTLVGAKWDMTGTITPRSQYILARPRPARDAKQAG